MRDDILKAIIELINSSPGHKAWLEHHDTERGGLGTKEEIHIIGPLVSHDKGFYPMPGDSYCSVTLTETTLDIGGYKFDLNDPESITKIEELFGCNGNTKKLDPISIITQLMSDE
jgi:hypothetical protein